MRCIPYPSRKPKALISSIGSMAVIAAGMALGLSIPCTAHAQVYREVFDFPSYTDPSRNGGDLLGISIKGSTVYVANSRMYNAGGGLSANNKSIQMFSLSGQYLGSFGSSGSGTGQFSSTVGSLAVAASGASVFVADGSANRVEVFDTAGNYISQFSGVAGMTGRTGNIGVNSTNIYVTDAQSDVVRIFDKSGNYISQFGSLGSGPGQFGSSAPFGPAGPGDILATDSRVYVADQANARVDVFDTAGNYVSQFQGYTGNPQFYFPGGIATNGTNLFVGDTVNDCVDEFDMNGAYLTRFGSVEVGGVAVSGTGVYAVDVFQREVRVFNVPEPGSVALLCGLGVCGVGWLRRRKRHK